MSRFDPITRVHTAPALEKTREHRYTYIMPTPFTHLQTAQKLLADPALSADQRAALAAESSAFLLGNIAADARVNSGTLRADTHFYSYDQPITEHPWRVMLARHPALTQAHDAAQQAFIAGYVAHLAMDEYWSLEMLRPHFVQREWSTRANRFFMLHILLIYMDERDLSLLEPWQHDTLTRAQPVGWLPFMPDATLRQWRDFIAGQISAPGGSQTLHIFGERIHCDPQAFRAILDSPQRMQAELWDHIPLGELARIESGMYDFATEQMLDYLKEVGGQQT